MKKCWCTIVLACFLFGLSCLISLVRDQVFAQPPIGPSASVPQVVLNTPGEPPRWLVDFCSIDDPGNPSRKIRVITIVDPESKRILVYHEDLALGTVKWISTRDIQPDILIGEFNAVKPTPREVADEYRRLNLKKNY